jgi:predicted ester cyclase
MSLEDNKALVRAAFERIVNDRDLELADRIVAAEYVDHSAASGSVATGPASFRHFVARQRAAYPDARVVVEDIMAEEDRGAARISMTGTPASGRPVRFRGTVWWRIAEGKIVERWGAAFAREEL